MFIKIFEFADKRSHFILFISLSEDKHDSVSEVSVFSTLLRLCPAFSKMTFHSEPVELLENVPEKKTFDTTLDIMLPKGKFSLRYYKQVW